MPKTSKTIKKPAKPVKKEKELEKKVPIEVASEEREKIEPEETTVGAKEKYYESVGRRKESIARVRLYTKKSSDTIDGEKALIIVNGKDYAQYFSDINLQNIIESSLRKLKSLNRFKATVLVSGGGLRGQADAIKHELARALVLFDINFRKKIKKAGSLTRDPRAKERRKYGLKKARKGPAWSKR